MFVVLPYFLPSSNSDILTRHSFSFVNTRRSFLRHPPASSPSCLPSNPIPNFPKCDVTTTARAQCPWRGLNAHGAGSMLMARCRSTQTTGLSSYNCQLILQLPHDLHHHRRNSLLEIRQIPQVEKSSKYETLWEIPPLGNTVTWSPHLFRQK